MKIKKEIHWVITRHWDTAGIEKYNQIEFCATEEKRDARARELSLECSEWPECGSDTVEIEVTAADLKEHPYAVALRSIADGSDHTGRWLDADGCCPAENEDDPEFDHGPGYTWTEYNEEEQAEWLESIPVIARDALATP